MPRARSEDLPPSDKRWELGALTTEEVLLLPAAVEFVDAARAFGLRRTAAHELARQGRFPVPLLTYGRTRRARRADIIAALGLSEQEGDWSA